MANGQAGESVVAASERLVAVAGEMSSPKLGVAALALALGRLCGAAGVSLDTAFVLAKLAHQEVGPLHLLSFLSPLPEEEQLS